MFGRSWVTAGGAIGAPAANREVGLIALTWAIRAWRSLAATTTCGARRSRDSTRRSASAPSAGRMPSRSSSTAGASAGEISSGATAATASTAGGGASARLAPAAWVLNRFIVKWVISTSTSPSSERIRTSSESVSLWARRSPSRYR